MYIILMERYGQLMIQYIKREYKIYAYKELRLGQVTVYLPPPRQSQSKWIGRISLAVV